MPQGRALAATRALLLLLGLVLALGIGEGLARLREAGTPPPGHGYSYDADWPSAWDPVIGRTAPRNRTVWARTGGRLVTDRYNSFGLLGPEIAREKIPGTLRVLALGDSFTEGREVDREERFVTLLQRTASTPGRSVEVLNAGRAGYAPSQYLLTYTREGRELRPDLVLVFFYMGNDVVGTLDGTSDGALVGYPVFRLENGQLQLIPPVPPTKPVSITIKEWLGQQFALYRLAAAAWHALPAGRQETSTQQEMPHVWKVFARDQPALVSKAWSLTAALIERLKRETAADDARLAIVIIPDRMQVDPDLWGQFLGQYRLTAADWDPDLPNRMMQRLCGELSVDCLDLLPEVRARGLGAYHANGHLSVAGHALLARSVGPWLVARGLVPP